MLTFIMFTRLNPEALRSPKALEELERQAMERVRKECPEVEWVKSYAILGPCDYLDIFRAKDIETASKYRPSSAPLAMPTPKFGLRPSGTVLKTSCGLFKERLSAAIACWAESTRDVHEPDLLCARLVEQTNSLERRLN
jgi:hypothetical protein